MPKSASWKTAENVVAAIETSLLSVPNARVVRNAMIPDRATGTGRQVDVLIEISVGDRTLRIGIEVRFKKQKLDVTEIEEFIGKKTLDIDRLVVFARAGYTNEARKKAALAGIELRSIAEVERPSWWMVEVLELTHRALEVVHFQLLFSSESEATLFPSHANPSLIHVVRTDSREMPIVDWIRSLGHQHLNCFSVTSSEFRIQINISDHQNLKLRLDSRFFACPREIVALFRVHERQESVPIQTFQADSGTFAFATSPTAENSQYTLIASDSGAATTLSLLIQPTDPARTKVRMR